jgi:hypothetical protein
MTAFGPHAAHNNAHPVDIVLAGMCMECEQHLIQIGLFIAIHYLGVAPVDYSQHLLDSLMMALLGPPSKVQV